MDLPTPGVPVYAVKSIAGGRPRVLHRNLLLPLQGRIRREGGVVGEEGSSDSESEDEMPEVARAPSRRSRGNTKPHVDPAQQVVTPAVLSEVLILSCLVHPPLRACQGMRISVKVRSIQLP